MDDCCRLVLPYNAVTASNRRNRSLMTLPRWGRKVLLLAIIPVPHRQRSSISEQTEADSLIHLRRSFQGHGADQTLAEFICGSWNGSSQSCSYFNYHGRGWARILVQVTIYRRLLIGRDGHLDQSEAYDIS